MLATSSVVEPRLRALVPPQQASDGPILGVRLDLSEKLQDPINVLAASAKFEAEQLAAPGKFESKRFCSDKKVILRWYVTFTHIFVVLYMKEPSHANSQTALSR
jgi:hypothetical protein